MMRMAVLTLVALAACQPSNPYPAGPAGSPVGVEWKLVELNGQPAGIGANGQPATLMLSKDGSKASGYAGCNQYSGSFTLVDDALIFGPLAVTRMACARGDQPERTYTMALEQTTGFAMTSDGLELRKGSTLLAKFTR
jgi:heat shock protein HslJ